MNHSPQLTDCLDNGTIVPNDIPDGGLGIIKSKNHIEQPATITFTDPDTGEVKTIPLKTDLESKQKETEQFKKSLPLKERRVFNVCDLPVGNIVDGFQYNEIDGTKKSDILLGTAQLTISLVKMVGM